MMRSKIKTFSRLLRVGQWYKNLLIFTPALFSSNALYPWQLLVGFFGFCCISSITYIFNDWIDRGKDRLHPLKKARPLASGKVTGKQALLAAFLLSIVVLFSIWQLGSFYGWILMIYFVLTNLYSLGLKNIPLVDILMISVNFSLRMLAGMMSFPNTSDLGYFGLLTGVILILLTHKRSADIKLLGERAIQHKPVLKYYTPGYNYFYRSLAYILVLFSAYLLWQGGWPAYRTIGFYLQLMVTSFILSKNPEYTSVPQNLFRSKIWTACLLGNLIIGIVY